MRLSCAGAVESIIGLPTPLLKTPEVQPSLLFDTHAHYDDSRFDGIADELLGSMPDRGVGLILNAACSIESCRASIALAEKYPFVYASAGVHPHDSANMKDSDLDMLRAFSEHPKVRAIGEIGLDYHYDFSPREIQKKRFRDQMELARETGLPVIIHEREAAADVFKILSEFPDVRGVCHCYSGSFEHAKRLLSLGYYLSFTGVVTFKNARRALETAAAIPAERIMIETDAPYMAPEPHRGKTNHSGYLKLICDKISSLRGMDPDEFARLTYNNGKSFFGI